MSGDPFNNNSAKVCLWALHGHVPACSGLCVLTSVICFHTMGFQINGCTCMLAGVSRLEAAAAEDRGTPSDTNALTLAAALDQLALVCAPGLCVFRTMNI